MRKRLTLERVAADLVSALGEDNCLLIGGLAVGIHGYVRATDDVDLIVRIPLQEARKLLAERDIETRLLRGDPFEGDFPCLKGVREGIPFDIMPPLVPLEWERSIALGKTGRLRVVDLDGLIRLKLKAAGPEDLLDVARLVLLHPEARDRARELALAYRCMDRLDSWLTDPRLRAKTREQKRRPGRARRRQE